MDIIERRSRRPESMETTGVLVCNCTSYCYFTLAIILFSVGTVITILALDDSENFFSSLGHMWVVGPIFISSGLMVAVKTIVYLRRETMVTFISRQRSLLRDLNYPLDLAFPRNPSNMTLPPAYDTVVGECGVAQHTRLLSVSSQVTDNVDSEVPPPSYEEAVLLGRQQQEQCTIVPSTRRMPCQDSRITVGTFNQERIEPYKGV